MTAGSCSSSKLIVSAFGNKGPRPISVVLGHETGNGKLSCCPYFGKGRKEICESRLEQSGCNKSSDQLARAPKVAIGAVKLQLSYLWLLDCHGRGREFEPRRHRHSFRQCLSGFWLCTRIRIIPQKLLLPTLWPTSRKVAAGPFN